MPLLIASVTQTLLSLAFVMVSVLMILTVLIQKPRGGGLSGAFGGAGGGAQAIFGAKTGDRLTTFTIVFFLGFIGLAMLLTYQLRPAVARDTTPAIETPFDPDEPFELDLGTGEPAPGSNAGPDAGVDGAPEADADALSRQLSPVTGEGDGDVAEPAAPAPVTSEPSAPSETPEPTAP